LTAREQARLIKELAARLVKSREPLDLSKVEEAMAYVERLRAAESRYATGRLNLWPMLLEAWLRGLGLLTPH
jgi:hypothetical protein